ncbi:MAG: MFS transporter, partial [Dehalococcoidales bacterium]
MNEKGNTFGRLDYLKITVLGFAIAGLAGSMNSIILPVRLLDFLGESQKNSYLGLITFAGLILAMITQPVIGAFSDRSRIGWGRRRPYILAGVILVLVFLPGIGLAGSLPLFFFVYCMLQVSSNTAQAPFQAFIPDLVPPDKRGRASGTKSVVEILGGILVMRLAAFLMGQYQEYARVYWLWITQGVLAAVFLVTGLFTLLKVKEKAVTESPGKRSISSFFRSFKIDLKHRDFGWFLASRSILGIPGVILQIFT